MMIENDRSNSSRLGFLSQLTALAESFGSKKQRADILKFAQEMRETVMTNLAPLDEKDMVAITSNALVLGGVNWVKKKLAIANSVLNLMLILHADFFHSYLQVQVSIFSHCTQRIYSKLASNYLYWSLRKKRIFLR
jgi:hypothetical protein